MSVRAAATLVGLGYTQVYTLEGGFNAWAAAGLPMVNP
jgi:rhodanese-related sulfurtransferase